MSLRSPRSGERPRILFVSYTARRKGPTKSLLYLLPLLRESFEVAVALPQGGWLAERSTEEGIPVFAFSSLGKRAIPGLARLIRREGFDLVYGNNTGGATRNAWIAARVTRVPFVCHMRGMAVTRGWRNLFFLRFTEAAIAVSKATAEAHRAYLGGTPCHVIYNGIPPRSPGDRGVARERLLEATGFPPDSVVTLSVGHLNPRKNALAGVRALHRTVERAPAARLAFVGSLDSDPDYVRRLRGEIATRGLEDAVSLLGFRSDVETLLDGSDLLVHTALADPHPRAVLEGMQAGLPVAAFATDGVAETIRDEETGYLVPKGDVETLSRRLVRLVEDAELRKRLGANGREDVRERFTATATARGVERVLAGVLSNRGREIPDPGGSAAEDAVRTGVRSSA